ncbi:MAG: hypothetical protein ACJ789_01275 [Thermomicrobiales bacterium]
MSTTSLQAHRRETLEIDTGGNFQQPSGRRREVYQPSLAIREEMNDLIVHGAIERRDAQL